MIITLRKVNATNIPTTVRYGRRQNSSYVIGDNLKQSCGNSDTLEFIYDQNGLSGVKQGSTNYVYRKNIQGDITHIFTLDGHLMACYTYDAWGNL